MINKVTTLESAMSHVKSGDCILLGGFLKSGQPERLTGYLAGMDVRDLTVVGMCTGTPECNIQKVFANGQVSHVIATYIRFNEYAKQMALKGDGSVELLPMGTLTERLRAGGAGLGGILTAVGIGTSVEEGKEKITVNGREYLLELPLRGNIALVHAYKADTMGNLIFKGTARNFNSVMPYSADYVIAEAEEIVEAGMIDPDDVIVPGAFVDAVVKAGE